MTTKIWTLEEIKNLLQTNDKFVMRSVVKIFEKQTEDEKEHDGTSHNNGIGYNGTDAFIMSRFAKFYIDKGYLSVKQLDIAKKKIQKYAKQLTKIANEKATTMKIENGFYTCTKCEIYSKELNLILSSIESSSPNTVCVVAVNDNTGIQNPVNLLKHESVTAAKEYAKALSNAEHDRRTLAIEKNI